MTGKKEGNAVITAKIYTTVGTFSKTCKVKVIKQSSGGGGCLTPDTLITLADGSQKRVDELESSDIIKAYDFDKGEPVDAPITLFHKVDEEEQVLTIDFSNGVRVGVVKDHCFFDLTDRLFVRIDSEEQSEELAGHRFALLEDNNIVEVELTGIHYEGTTDSYYAPVSEAHLNCFANGLLNMPGYVSGFCNVFELEEDELKYDANKKAEEMESAEEIDSDIFEFIKSSDIYQKNKLDWIRVSVAKGLISLDELMDVYEFCQPYFVE